MSGPPDPRARDLWLALGGVGLVGLGALLGFAWAGSSGALTGATIGFGACVLAFTLSTVVWAVGAARRFRETSRGPR